MDESQTRRGQPCWYKVPGVGHIAINDAVTIEATVTSVLIPWNTCGAMQASVLGVATFTYAPFAFFNWLSPLMTLLFALMGWRQLKRANLNAEEVSL